MRAARARLYADKTDPAGRGDLMMQDPGGVCWGMALRAGVGISRSRRGQWEQARCWGAGVVVAVSPSSPYCFCPSEIEGGSSGERVRGDS